MRRVFREVAILALLALLPALVSGAVQLQWRTVAAPKEGEVSVALAKQWGAKVLWVDARSRAKFERKSIPGAVLLNADEWEALVAKFLDEWDPEKAIVVYGDGAGDNATEVAHRLKEELKLDGVWVLQGGWDAWTQQ
jgi:rhodanese-related sulfurtransferase